MVRGVLLDLSGVLYSGDEPLPGAPDAVARLATAGLPVRFLTNTTSKPRRALAEKLARLGFDISEDAILTPAVAAHEALAAEALSAHLLAHPDLAVEFESLPRSERMAVVVGDAGQGFTYDRLNTAFRHLMEGAPLVALAANRMFRDADGGLSLDAGPFVRALEYAAGIEARLVGKPAVAFFEAGAAAMDCAPADVAMVGDDAEADVAGALAAGIGTGILVRTGKYRDGDENRCNPAPTRVVSDISAAVDVILGEDRS